MVNPEHERNIKQLFNQLFNQLLLSSYRIVKDWGQAEDIVQDVFVKVWQNFDRIGHVTDKKAYLFKAVKNSSLNFLRDVKNKQKRMDEILDLYSYTINPHEDELSGYEIGNKIYNAVNKLPENWKEAFVLSKYGNLKYYEIADEMAISQKTVEKYISKALHFLRHELKDIFLIIYVLIKFL